jgi:D-alanyl-D-alanine carboxypeptidase/D-alanyl-D-alanine-endopeptidase (penicillin-binding protein 4)
MAPCFHRFCLLLSLAGLLGASPLYAKSSEAQNIVDSWLKGQALEGLEIGISVLDTSTKITVATHRDNAMLNPASGAKLFTTAAALHELELTHRWLTRLYGRHSEGGLEGPLFFVGGGDPKLMPEHLRHFADELVSQGVMEMPYGIVVDTQLFMGSTMPPAYDQKSTDAGYRPAIGAAGSNFGAFQVVVRPGKKAGDTLNVTVEPMSSYVDIQNRSNTVNGKKHELRIHTKAQENGPMRLIVEGTMGLSASTYRVRKRVANPDLFSAYLLADALRTRGVLLGGELRVANKGLSWSQLPELVRRESADLVDTISDINTWSNNFMAEMLFRYLGRANGSSAGSWQRSCQTVTEIMLKLGIPQGQFRIVNGSGLYQATKASAGALTRLLLFMYSDPVRGPPYMESLAVSGQGGTLSTRLAGKRTGGKILAKTGTLDGITSLSGLVTTRHGRKLLFSVIINGGHKDATSLLHREIDRLLSRLVML